MIGSWRFASQRFQRCMSSTGSLFCCQPFISDISRYLVLSSDVEWWPMRESRQKPEAQMKGYEKKRENRQQKKKKKNTLFTLTVRHRLYQYRATLFQRKPPRLRSGLRRRHKGINFKKPYFINQTIAEKAQGTLFTANTSFPSTRTALIPYLTSEGENMKRVHFRTIETGNTMNKISEVRVRTRQLLSLCRHLGTGRELACLSHSRCFCKRK